MRMLDLFCGEGLAAWGYWLSGRFTEIVGVDNDPDMRTRYSFDFVCADAMRLDYEFLMSFDFIHASPPCQAYSKRTPDKGKHPKLIAATHLMLTAAGLPYVIENVEGSGQELRPNIVASGEYFGLPSVRRRYFHASPVTHNQRWLERRSILMRTRERINIHAGSHVARIDVIKALGLDVINENRLQNLTVGGMEQGIPPAMTLEIARLIFPHKALIGEKRRSSSSGGNDEC